MPSSKQFIFPDEVLQRIALERLLADPVGLPTPANSLSSLLATCRRFHNALSHKSCPFLYADLFRTQFDLSAPFRRFGPRALFPTNLAVQLYQYYDVMKRIRSGDIYAPDVEETLQGAFIMMMENDGRNLAQLRWAGIESFVNCYVRQRLMEGATYGWPLEIRVNALALWLMWLTITPETIDNETPEGRHELLQLILPYVILSCRYPHTLVPPNHFHLPLQSTLRHANLHSAITVHGYYPLYRNNTSFKIPQHFGAPRTLASPLVTVAARLLFFSRKNFPFQIPPNLPPTRAEAIAHGYQPGQPTQEDIHAMNRHAAVQFPTLGTAEFGMTSAQAAAGEDEEQQKRLSLASPPPPSYDWDQDWMRLEFCHNPWENDALKGIVYCPGSLDGLWEGRTLNGNEQTYIDYMGMAHRPPTFGENDGMGIALWPMQVRLREHHAVSPQLRINTGGRKNGVDDGFGNAWLPEEDGAHGIVRDIDSHEGTLKFRERASGCLLTTYETYRPGVPNSHNSATCSYCTHAQMLDEEEQATAREAARNRSPSPLSSSSQAGEDVSEEEFWQDVRLSACNGVDDIVFTGETDVNFGMAWHHFTFYGRLRPYDGLISMVRVPEPAAAYMGRWLFSGYLTGQKNIVGTWRPLRYAQDMPAFEMPFILSKRLVDEQPAAVASTTSHP